LVGPSRQALPRANGDGGGVGENGVTACVAARSRTSCRRSGGKRVAQWLTWRARGGNTCGSGISNDGMGKLSGPGAHVDPRPSLAALAPIDDAGTSFLHGDMLLFTSEMASQRCTVLAGAGDDAGGMS